MWQGSRLSKQHQPKCHPSTSTDILMHYPDQQHQQQQQPQQQQQQHQCNVHQITPAVRCSRVCSSQAHRVYLHFPPPPSCAAVAAGPQPSTSASTSPPLCFSPTSPSTPSSTPLLLYPSSSSSAMKMSEDNMMSLPGPSTSSSSSSSSQHQHQRLQQQQQLQPLEWDVPNEYSYAYYVPGPPTRHTNVPSKYPGTYREGSYRSRHTYLTRYGTEENIYEEISEVARARLSMQKLARSHQLQNSVASLNQSLVEEEVRRVQSGHRRVLGELNLSVEAMLMPSSPKDGSDDNDRDTEMDDQLADLLTVGPTDDLLSPIPANLDLDSGFSGSSSGASYRSTAGSLKRGMNRPKSTRGVGLNISGGNGNNHYHQVPSDGESSKITTAMPGKKFWSKKAWKKFTAFPNLNKTTTTTNNSNNNNNKDEPRVRSSTWESTACEHRFSPSQILHSRTFQHSLSQRSSEDSWCSGSELELSSDEESDRSGASLRSNGQLRSTLNKARTLCDKLRGSTTANRLSLGDGGTLPGDQLPQSPQNQSRLSRWFSIRRGSTHQYDIENIIEGQSSRPQSANKMPLLPEVEEENIFPTCTSTQKRQVPPTLPPPPSDLTPQQIKRRMIISAIVHSENSYVATLQRLVNDYKKPLEESSPAILSSSKIAVLFHRLPEILQCHTLFRIALAESIRNWDRDEKIGDVFVASFSKAIVLDIYSGFINNFSVAMDVAKQEAKRKSALADFLKVKQISSHDRLSFFGLMVKPVQRFPQFILFLQDLLKHTPQGHHDRMSLQLALTQLESLAEMLNERKREAEQYQAFKEMLRHISGKFSVRPLSDCNRYLLREDNVMQLEYNQNGIITKAKSRRLLLLNDLVVCVAVAPKVSDDFSSNERLSLKWTYSVSDVEIQDTSASPTLSRVLTAGLSKGGSLKSNSSFDINSSQTSQDANNLCSEMSNLMQDYEIMSRINDLVGNLKGCYENINVDNTKKTLQKIQTLIQQKDEEMAWVDSCCLQLVVKNKGKDEVLTFKTNNPSIKKEWITELRLAQLALDPNNSPAWEVPEQEHRPSTKMPLFVKSQCVYNSQHQTEVRCGCYYTVTTFKTAKKRHRSQSYLWVCTTDGASSHISILSQSPQQASNLKDLSSFSLVETQITAMEFVKGLNPPCPSLGADTVWMGTDSHRLLLYSADEPEKQEQIGNVIVPHIITQIKNYCDSVFVALNNGTLQMYKRGIDGSWLLKEPQVINLGCDPVSCLLPINLCLYAACGKKVWVLNSTNGDIQKNFSIKHEHVGNVNLMAHSGIGLWISLKHSSTICLYHTETFKHLQDINIASNVMRVTTTTTTTTTTNRDCVNNNRSQVNVTSLLACKGLLWVGTNVGIALTIPLPRLEGVPIISGRVNISYHAHFGPITFLLALQPRIKEPKKDDEPLQTPDEDNNNSTQKQDKLRYNFSSSPIVVRRRRSKEIDFGRISKTLPRGFGNCNSSSSSSSQNSNGGDTCDVYGLYGELMYIKDYDGDENILTDPIYESLRRSDPELAQIPNKVSTLDRRLKMKVSRPRSLDLSNWSVDSRSSSLCTSSGSEESMALKHFGRSISRNNSNASRQLDDVCENSVIKEKEKPVVQSAIKNLVDNTRRTVITIMGGRGYVNFRQPCCPADKSKSSFSIKESNRNDAHIVLWELKL